MQHKTFASFYRGNKNSQNHIVKSGTIYKYIQSNDLNKIPFTFLKNSNPRNSKANSREKKKIGWSDTDKTFHYCFSEKGEHCKF